MRKFHSAVMFAVAAISVAAGPANATLTLTAAGIANGFTLSTFYSDPNVYYGALGVTTTANGTVIATGYARNELYIMPNIDGQTYATITTKVSSSWSGSPYEVATANGKTYFSPGFGGTFYEVNPTTLALTPLVLNTPVTPYLGLWANPVTGHLLSSSYSGLVDIDPVTGNVHVITSLVGFDGVTVSPDGLTAYAEYGGNILAYDIATGTFITSYSGAGHSPDGTGVISGGALNGNIIANNNDGTISMIDAMLGTQTVIAIGGGRGDFVGPDLTNGTLFLSMAEAVYRLGLPGAVIGGPPPAHNGVPEPATLALVGAGLASVRWLRRKPRKC